MKPGAEKSVKRELSHLKFFAGGSAANVCIDMSGSKSTLEYLFVLLL